MGGGGRNGRIYFVDKDGDVDTSMYWFPLSWCVEDSGSLLMEREVTVVYLKCTLWNELLPWKTP